MTVLPQNETTNAPGNGLTTLTLLGPCPSKKNLYRRGKSGGLFLDREVAAQIDALILQAQSQWTGDPLKHPSIDVTFYVATRRGDRDNKLSCILDVMQKAGVLVNDNIASCNGLLTLHPAVISAHERVVIELIAPEEKAYAELGVRAQAPGPVRGAK